MSKNIPSLISWDKLTSKIKPSFNKFANSFDYNHLQSESAKMGRNLAESALDGNTDISIYSRILKGYDDGDPEIMDMYSNMFQNDASFRIMIDENKDKIKENELSELNNKHQEAFWDRIIEICKYHLRSSEKTLASTFEVMCKTASRDFNITIIANSHEEAFQKTNKYFKERKIDWFTSQISVSRSKHNILEIFKESQYNEEISLEEAANRVIRAARTGSVSDFPEHEGKVSRLVGQIHTLVDVMNQVTGSSNSAEDILNALANAASEVSGDIEIAGDPEEAHVLFPKQHVVSHDIDLSVKTAKKSKKTGKNKPTNPSLWARAKAAAKSKFDVYPCVPLDSLAITKTGPQIYENLKIGDEILSYNIEKDELEWNSILNMHYFENAPIVQIGKATGFQVKCTPNHKWVVRRGENYQNTELIETKDLNKHMQLVVCASLENTSELVMEKWSKKDSWIEKVLSMSKNEREIFLASAIVYDGHDKGVSTKILNRHSFGFSQKNEDHFYATILAAYLNGYHVNFADKYPDMHSATIIRNKKTHSTQNLITKNVEPEDVWCPETANGTWVMIQNGFLTITGNSAYANAFAVKWYKKRGGGWRKSGS